MALKRSSEFLRLGTFFLVILDTILNSKMQKSLLLQFVPPQIINALHSRYNTKFKNAKIPSVAICSTSNHKCPGLLLI